MDEEGFARWVLLDAPDGTEHAVPSTEAMAPGYFHMWQNCPCKPRIFYVMCQRGCNSKTYEHKNRDGLYPV